MSGAVGRRALLAAAAAGLAGRAGAQALGSQFRSQAIRWRTLDAPAGRVFGRTTIGGFLFAGIPYAQPPVGPLRYASPRPLPAGPLWPNRNASIQTLGGAASWLYEGGWPQSEDCLALNVWTPDPNGRAPVMVWLHGGAWRTGYGNAAGTQGEALLREGVVLVTVNYRLGALGWLAHPALRDGDTGAFANWGLQDQIAALRWVKANIAAFGGDPDNITLFGQSAGGSSTASIAQDPRNAGLLHKAIIQSGSLHGAPGFPEVDTAAAYAEALARRLGTDVPGLRGVPALDLHRAELTQARDPAMVRSMGRPPVLPVLDGTVLRVWPRDGTLPAIPLLIGTTQTEATFWFDLIAPDGEPILTLKPPADPAALRRAVADLAALYQPESHAAADRVVAAYEAAARSRGESDGVLPVWIAIYTDVVFRLRARAAAAKHAASGHPAYLYEFQRPLAAPAHGVPHTSEIPFVFGTWGDPFFWGKCVGPDDPPVVESVAALSRTLTGAWASFSHSGAPGEGWQPVTSGALPVNTLGGPGGAVTPKTDVRTGELAAWTA